MKTFKITRFVLQIVSLALFLGSLVICGIDVAEANTAFMAAMTAYVGIFALASVGIFLMSSSADTPRRVGHGLAISSYAIGLTIALIDINNASAAILMLVAVIALVFYYFCCLIIKIMQKSFPHAESPSDDIRIVRVKEWKQIMEEGIISKEEYEAKRCQILGIKMPSEKPAEEKAESKPRA